MHALSKRCAILTESTVYIQPSRLGKIGMVIPVLVELLAGVGSGGERQRERKRKQDRDATGPFWLHA